MVVVLDMGNSNSFNNGVWAKRRIYSREQLKAKYKFACKIGCYLLARIYLYALYGKKTHWYEYECTRGAIYAFKYPPIRV